MAQMTLREFITNLQDLARENPEVLDLPVWQQSCFDAPYAFDTSGAGIETLYSGVYEDGGRASTYTNREEAVANCEEEEAKFQEFKAVLLGAF